MQEDYLSLEALLALEIAIRECGDAGTLPVASMEELAMLLLPGNDDRLQYRMAAIVTEWILCDAVVLEQAAQGWKLVIQGEGVA